MNVATETADINFQVRCEGDDWYLFARVRCNDPRVESLRDYWRAFADACATSEAEKLMVERSSAPPVSSFDPFELIESLPELNFTRKRVAFVDTRLEPQDVHTVESAATFHGIRLRAFINENDAEKWLLS